MKEKKSQSTDGTTTKESKVPKCHSKKGAKNINASQISANWKKIQVELQSAKPKNGTKKRLNAITPKVEPKNEIWFDDVDPCLIKSSQLSSNSDNKLCKESSFKGMTRCIAMDCEMVGTGPDGSHSILARVSIVNLYGHCIYDKFVKPIDEVTDYRTDVSGIRPENIKNGEDFKTVQKEVYEIVKDRILVGHSIKYDLKVLFLSHPKNMIRDTSVYFRKFFNKRTPSLRKLTEVYLGVQIQHGEHDSVTDAQATMRLYTLFKRKWESSIGNKPKGKTFSTHNQTTTLIQIHSNA